MSLHGDKIYCLTCGGITNEKSGTQNQDTRLNPRFLYRCVHCMSFYTINATQFLETKKNGYARFIMTDTDRKRLVDYAEKLKADGIIKKYSIEKRGKKYKLYERRNLRKLLLKKIGEKRT